MKESPEKEILNLVAYFDVFNYPLKVSEIDSFLQLPSKKLKDQLQRLVDIGVLSSSQKFIGTDDIGEKSKRRIQGNDRAKNISQKAEKNAALISKFPFVRGVLISGSFSKGFVSEDGDIDYFVVTKPGRLWIARTSLILYKKLFLLNSHEYFCVNYFVDEENLEIEEKNIFTATELATLLPMVNAELYEKLINKNTWVKDYYPSLFHKETTIKDLQSTFFKRISEKGFSGKIGVALDNYFMKITLKRWQKKFGFLSDEDFEVAMKTNTNVSKHHPNNFQRKVLEEHQKIYQNLIDLYEERANVKTAI